MKSFSLIEVIVFVAILAIFFVTSMGVVTFMLQNSKANEHKIVATQYAQELASWLRAQKESNWNDFVGAAGTYCFNNSSLPSTLQEATSGSCGTYGLDSFYKRAATLTYDGSTQTVRVTETVEWNEGSRVFSVPITAQFSRFEQ